MINGIVTAKDLAQLLGINLKTLYTWNFRDKLPEPDMIHGRQMFWTKKSANRILEEYQAGKLDIKYRRKHSKIEPLPDYDTTFDGMRER